MKQIYIYKEFKVLRMQVPAKGMWVVKAIRDIYGARKCTQ